MATFKFDITIGNISRKIYMFIKSYKIIIHNFFLGVALFKNYMAMKNGKNSEYKNNPNGYDNYLTSPSEINLKSL